MMDRTPSEDAARGRAPLRDVLETELHGETGGERLADFVAQGGNPRRFLAGGIPVTLFFQSSGESMEERIKAHFLSLKT